MPSLASPLQLSGAIIAPVALLFMGYALFMYKKRTYQAGPGRAACSAVLVLCAVRGGTGAALPCPSCAPPRPPPPSHPTHPHTHTCCLPLCERAPSDALSLRVHPPQILRRETVRYDDQRGPVVLTVILLLVFALAYILAMVWIF